MNSRKSERTVLKRIFWVAGFARRPELLIFLWTLMMAACFPSELQAFDSGMPPLKESQAFQEYSRRPQSDLSRLIYLIDRFKEADIEIIYDGLVVQPGFAANVAKWFLHRRYSDQTAKQWINEWCTETVPAGNLIWVKDASGAYESSREVLLSELEKLEKACRNVCQETG